MPQFTPLLLLFVLTTSLVAQDRERWERTVQPRPDQTIFSPLDLPPPSRIRTASGAPGPDYWQQQVNYRIEASLEPESRTVRGSEHVIYVNNSPDALDYLWLILEQNILKKDSIGTIADGMSALGGPSEASDGVQIESLTAAGKELEHRVYDTMARVDLPQPIPPGGRFEFDLRWNFQVPKLVFRRYGTLESKQGTVWELAQWFPAVAVYDDVHGWNTLPYLGAGEFYTNFSTFDVAITAPRDHLVVATGVLQNPKQVYTAQQLERLEQARRSEETVVIRGQDEVSAPASRPAGEGPLTWRFHAEKVRTFAWASSAAFILDAAALGETLLQSAYTQEDLPVWGKSTQMLRKAIAGYSRRWFPYPYPMATNVAGVEGGMEYPMIIFCRSRDEAGLWGVTTHEIGHTWFPMVVNTDERRHAWMDEGFNTFVNAYSNEDWYGTAPRTRRTGGMLPGGDGRPIMTPADQLSGMQLGMSQYFKTGNGLQILREYVLGPERFDSAFRTYIRRWAFKSPQPADFFRSMEDASGMDLQWFWRGWFAENTKLDQAVDSVQQPSGKKPGRVTFTNLDRMVMPLTYRVKFDDGTVEEQRLPVQVWFQTDKVTRTLQGKGEIVEVRVDPERMLPDARRANNVWNATEK